MANTFVEKATKFIPLLDEVYKKGSVTSMLDVDPAVVQFNGTKTVKLPKILLQGYADYNRSTGYVDGSVTVSYSSHELQYDRARSFSIDVIDGDEAAFNLFATTSTEFVRVKEVPEIDATRFKEIHAKASAGSGTIVEEDLTVSTAVESYDTAEATLMDNEVNPEDLIMFASNEYYKLMKQSDQFERRMDVNTNNGEFNRVIKMLDGMVPVIRVPKSRFYDDITLLDGTTGGQEDGGFEPIAATSKELNFVLADRNALKGIVKRGNIKIITADKNQSKDANDVKFRTFHDLIVPDNKTQGIYISKKTSAFDA